MARWREGLKADKLQRVDVIDERVDRLNKRKSELLAEKKRIMNAGIHANRRKDGKT